jgi:hypothetical protein
VELGSTLLRCHQGPVLLFHWLDLVLDRLRWSVRHRRDCQSRNRASSRITVDSVDGSVKRCGAVEGARRTRHWSITVSRCARQIHIASSLGYAHRLGMLVGLCWLKVEGVASGPLSLTGWRDGLAHRGDDWGEVIGRRVRSCSCGTSEGEGCSIGAGRANRVIGIVPDGPLVWGASWSHEAIEQVAPCHEFGILDRELVLETRQKVLLG